MRPAGSLAFSRSSTPRCVHGIGDPQVHLPDDVIAAAGKMCVDSASGESGSLADFFKGEPRVANLAQHLGRGVENIRAGSETVALTQG